MVTANGRSFSRRRILKAIVVNVLLTSYSVATFVLLLWLLLATAQILDARILLLATAYCITLGTIIYGNGMYISSIITIAFTKPKLMSQKEYQQQAIATHLLHGVLSHTLIYSSFIVAVCLLAIIDTLIGAGTHSLLALFSLCGVITGMLYAYAQIYNGTLVYQFLVVMISSIFFYSF